MSPQLKWTGFTIVELLIVITVIAVLATISIVAYRDIQNRANDAAIQSDLENFAKKIYVAAADTGEFPAGGARRVGGVTYGNSTIFPGFKFKATRNAYSTTMVNLYYCTGIETDSSQRIFRVYAKSRSGNTFMNSSNAGIQSLGKLPDVTTVEGINALTCQGLSEPYSWSYGFYNTTQEWWEWVGG